MSYGMSNVQVKLASVMETLVHAAVAELGKLVEDSSVFVFNLELTQNHNEDDQLTAKLQTESQMKMVTQFASVMETLGNEALGKIMKVVDHTWKFKTKKGRKRKVFIPGRKMSKPQASILNILSEGGMAEEHSYGGSGKRMGEIISAQPAEPQDVEEPASPFIFAVTVKDEPDDIDLGAIAERVAADAFKVEETPASDHQYETVSIKPKPKPAKPLLEKLVRQRRKLSICKQCGKGFSTQSNLKAHMRNHTNEKPFACPICTKCFVNKPSLKDHIGTHTNFKCLHCGRGFGKKAYLVSHSIIHTAFHKRYYKPQTSIAEIVVGI